MEIWLFLFFNLYFIAPIPGWCLCLLPLTLVPIIILQALSTCYTTNDIHWLPETVIHPFTHCNNIHTSMARGNHECTHVSHIVRGGHEYGLSLVVNTLDYFHLVMVIMNMWASEAWMMLGCLFLWSCLACCRVIKFLQDHLLNHKIFELHVTWSVICVCMCVYMWIFVSMATHAWGRCVCVCVWLSALVFSVAMVSATQTKFLSHLYQNLKKKKFF